MTDITPPSGSLVTEGQAPGLRRDFTTEAWQFFAFVFAAATTLIFALLDEVPRSSWIGGGVCLHLPPWAPLSGIVKVLVFVVLGYLTLVCACFKEWIIGVLPYIKKGKTRWGKPR